MMRIVSDDERLWSALAVTLFGEDATSEFRKQAEEEGKANFPFITHSRVTRVSE